MGQVVGRDRYEQAVGVVRVLVPKTGRCAGVPFPQLVELGDEKCCGASDVCREDASIAGPQGGDWKGAPVNYCRLQPDGTARGFIPKGGIRIPRHALAAGPARPSGTTRSTGMPRRSVQFPG